MPKTGKSVQGGRINYSQWDHIEVSDDEDDTHPNVDTPSLFRWRHQARVERMEAALTEKQIFENRFKEHSEKYDACRKRVESTKGALPADLQTEWDKLRSEHEKLIAEEQEFQKKERSAAWNVDTISKEKKSRSIINKAAFKNPREELSEEERLNRLKEFLEKNKKLVKELGMLSKVEDTQKFYADHPELVCEETANQLVLWCIDLAVEEKWALMDHVSQQTVQLNFILELSRTIEQDPRSCVGPFYMRFALACEAAKMPVTGATATPERQYWESYEDELKAFRERVRKRAKERIAEAMAKYEEEEKQKRLGPGGLDPVEVMESLPREMQECFEKRDIPMLQQLLLKMSVEEAKYHMKRCVDSGLWVPGPTDALNPNRPKGSDDEEEETFDEPNEEKPHEATAASTIAKTEASSSATTDSSSSTTTTTASSSASTSQSASK